LRPVGRVGRAHGWDGSFYVESADAEFAEGTEVFVGDRRAVVERRAGTDARPLIRLSGIDPRELAREPLLLDEPLEEGEYLTSELVGCEVVGLGPVRRVINGPSCDVLEVGPDAILVPLISDAVKRVDPDAREIEVDREFLGL
jgi:16S rRNA processing protein RimM